MALDDLNLSELVLLAQETNDKAHRGLGREVLTKLALGEDVAIQERQIDKTRLTIMEFVDAHWDQVRPLLSCPAKTRDPRACFQCTDIQVLECATSNDIIFIWKRNKDR